MAAQAEAARSAQENIDNGSADTANNGVETSKGEDWEDERLDKSSTLQALVDRLHDKGEKEVNRIVKVSRQRPYAEG